MSTLIVAPPCLGSPSNEGPRDCAYVLLNAQGQSTSHGSAPLPLLPSADEVVLMVAASMLSWHQVVLPVGTLGKRGQDSRLRALLEGLLEEQLLDEPAELHFALAPDASPSQGVWVAACSRTWLNQTLAALQGVGREVDRILPEIHPPESNTEAPNRTIHAVGAGPADAWLRVSDEQGVWSIPLDSACLHLLGLRPDDLVLAEPSVAAVAEAFFPSQVQVHTTEQRWESAARGRWNLAQLEFERSTHHRWVQSAGRWAQELWRAPQWRMARWGLAVLAVAQIVGLNLLAWRESQSLAGKQTEIRQIIATTFPQIKVVVEPLGQMQRAVTDLQLATGTSSGKDVEAMLGALASALPAGPPAESMEFDGSRLQLKGLTLEPAAFAAARERLAAQNLDASFDGGTLSVRPKDFNRRAPP